MLATIVCFWFCFFTFLVHCLTVMTSSDMTMSTHLVQGSLIFPICLFTMVSKAISGVKRPVLPARERHRISQRDQRASRRVEEEKRQQEEEEKEEEWVKRRVLVVQHPSPFLSFHPLKQFNTRREERSCRKQLAYPHVRLRVFYIFPQLIK